MSKSVKKEILASEYSSEQVLAVNTSRNQQCMPFLLLFTQILSQHAGMLPTTLCYLMTRSLKSPPILARVNKSKIEYINKSKKFSHKD